MTAPRAAPPHAAAWPWALAAGLLVSAILPGLEQPGRGARELLLLLSLAAVPLLAGPRAGDRVPRALLVLLAIATAAGAGGVLAAPAPERWLVLRDLLVLAAPWWFGWAAATARPDDGAADAGLARGAGAALLWVAAAGLAQAWLGWEGLPAARPPAGPFVNRNVAAQALVLLVPLAAGGALADRSRRWRVASLAAAGLGSALLVATRSRGALIAMASAALGALLLAAVARGRRDPAAAGTAASVATRRRVALVGAAVAAGLLAGAIVPGTGAARLPSLARSFELLGMRERSRDVRAALQANSMQLVARRPLLGAGPGRFPVVYPLVAHAVRETPDFGTRHPEHVHQDALEYAVELGVPAAWCLLLALGLGLFGLVRRALVAPGAGHALAAAALAGVLVHSLVSFPLHSPASAWLAWVLAGRGWSAFCRPGGEAARPRRQRWPWVAALLVAALALPVAIRDARAQRALGRGWAAHGGGDCAAALRAARTVAATSLRHRDLVLAGQIAFDCERDPGRSLPLLERALTANPHHPRLLRATGARRLKAGRPEGARELFLHATEILPESGRAWLGLAMAEEALGREEAARRACVRALAQPEPPEAVRAYCGPRTGRAGPDVR